jgi:hypothetical protein
VVVRHDIGVIAASLLFLIPPVVPPPPAPQAQAAIALWAENVTEHQRSEAIDLAVINATWRSLQASGLRFGQRRWTQIEAPMRARLTEYVPKDGSRIDREAFACASDSVARSMSVEEIDALRRFFSTSEGKSFWVLTEPHEEKLKACYAEALKLEAQETDYRALGLRVPKHIRDRTSITVIE